MSSLLLLSCSPLKLLALGAALFGVWIAYDAVRVPAPKPGAQQEQEPALAAHELPFDKIVVVAQNRPPLHMGMLREVAQHTLGAAQPETAEISDIVDGMPVSRVSYQLNLPRANHPFRSAVGGWHRVTIDFVNLPNGPQAIHRLKAVAISPPPSASCPAPVSNVLN